jgi:hypothetical protein
LAKNVVNLGDDTRMLEGALAEPASLWTIYDANCGLVSFLSGYTAETCRDLGHTQMAMNLTFNSAQIAWNQGLDLYTPNADRLTVALERLESWILGVAPAPLKVTGNDAGSFEMAYNHFANIMGMRLPYTEKLVGINRGASQFGAVGYQNGTNCDTLPSLTSGPDEFCSFKLSTYSSPTATSGNHDDPRVSISSNDPDSNSSSTQLELYKLFSRNLAAQNNGYTGLWTVLMFGDLNRGNPDYP